MTTKQITLAIAILGTAGDVALAATGVLSPAWAALVAALGAGAYGLVRTLQKVATGAPLKSLLTSTETWGAALAIVAPILAAIGGLLPPEKAAQVSGLAVIMATAARAWQKNALPPKPVPASDDVTKPTATGDGATPRVKL